MKKRFSQLSLWLEQQTETNLHRVLKGGFWLVSGKIVLIVISLAVMTVLGNWLSKEEFGAYQYVLSIINILTLISLPGIGSALTRSIAQKKDGSLIEAFQIRAKWGLLAGIVTLAISLWYFYHTNMLLGYSFLAVSLLFGIKEAGSVAFFYWDGKRKFKVHTLLRVGATVFASLALIVTVLFSDSISLILFVFFAAQALALYVVYWKTKKTISNSETDLDLSSHGKHLTWMLVASTVANQIDKVLLWKFLGPVELAIYSFAVLPISKIHETMPIPSLTLSKLSELSTTTTYKKRVLRNFLQSFIVLIPFTALCFLGAPFIYKILFPQYMEAVQYFQLLSLSFLTIPFTLLGTAFVAEMKKRELYITRVLAPTIQIILLVLLTLIFGVLGAVLAFLIGRALRGLLELFYFIKM